MIINTHTVRGTPLLEVVPEDQEGQPLPLVFFHHGGTNKKEVVIGYGVELAKRGFRVILPDALHHGDNDFKELRSPVDYLPVLEDAVRRHPYLIDYFQEVIADDYVASAGLSLGGKITNMLMVADPDLKAGASLMCGVALTDFWQYFYDTVQAQREEDSSPLSEYPSGDFIQAHDLSRHLELVNGRPMYFWHSKDDHWVPFRYAYYPVKKLKDLPEGKRVIFTITDEDEHVVPKTVVSEMADFLKNSYDTYCQERSQ